MGKRLLFLGVFFSVLIVTFVYFVYKDEDLSKSLLPVLNDNVQNFSFINQDGKQLTEANVEGKVYVAEYFFTSCKGICPDMNNNMRIAYDELKDEKDFYILSHTSDPETDSVPQMKHYADSMKVDTKKWIFLTGRKDSLYNAARVSYTVDDPANNLVNIDDQFIHSQFWALVDRNGDVRKIYDGLKEKEVRQMIKDARIWLKKEVKKPLQ